MSPRDLFGLPFEDEPVRHDEPAAPARRVFTVSDLTATIRGLLESSLGEIWIEGELSNCKPWHTGHLYFTLKDGGAQIRAIMFRSAVRTLRFKPEDGLHVLARGRVSVYEPKGEYQLVCEHMEPHGLGARQLAFEQLKKTLQAEGLFDAARKRPLPSLPRKIGIVTSLDGAALRDIIKVLHRRYPNVHLVIRPARVQGEGAAEDIARGLTAVGRGPGVVVIIRGGGGGWVVDLGAFNVVGGARAIARAPVPVISAVGHEVDFTIADFVADLRAPTPSAAAEIVVLRKDEFVGRIDRLAGRAGAAVERMLERRRVTLHTLAGRRGMAGWPARLALRSRRAAELTVELRQAAHALAGRRERRLRELRLRLVSCDVRQRLAGVRGRLTGARGRIDAAIERARLRADARRRVLAGRLDSLSPLAVLGRGYAVCWNADRSAIIRTAAAAAVGDRVRVTLHQGELGCEVKDRRQETGDRR
jgi:exodeoxyribonuclease VII large subunit